MTASQYAFDTLTLKNVVQEIYKGVEPKPRIIAPGGFFDPNWFKEFVDRTPGTLDIITHHIYNLGPGIFLLHIKQIYFNLKIPNL